MTDTKAFRPEWPPNWTNAHDNGLRSYSSHDSVLIQDGDVLRCAVDESASKFVSIFGPVFVVFLVSTCWLGTDDFRQRVAFTTFALFCGCVCFGLLYGMMKHHQAQGDYVVVDHTNERIELPRHNRVFRTTDVQCLQLLSGRDIDCESITHSDLNLLVDESGVIVRYQLIGNPNREHARAIAKAMQTPLIEQAVPAGWYRSSDSPSHERDSDGSQASIRNA